MALINVVKNAGGHFVDWNMPNMSGIEFIEASRKESGGKITVYFLHNRERYGLIQKALGRALRIYHEAL